MRRLPVLRGLFALVLLATLPCARPPRAGGARELWLYEGSNLADSSALGSIEPLWRRAAAAGYARVVLADQRFSRLDEQAPGYFTRIRRLRELAATLHLEIVPAVAVVGRGNGAMLAMDPNLAEALPVRDARLEVRGGIARVVADPPVALAPTPDRLDPGASLAGGTLAIADAGRAAWELDVAPWRCYHVAVRVASEDFRGTLRVRVTGDRHELAFASVAPPRGAAPEARDVVFNSLDHRHVTVTFALGRGASGATRWSDWRIEEAGPVNAVRRPGMEPSIAGLVEGRDYDPIVDPKLGASPWRGQFDAWHEPPAIRVRRPDGTRLTASWWQAAVLERGQVAVCLADTAVRARLAGEIARVRELFGARTLFLMHDEIRAIGWDPPCAAAGGVAGKLLADNVRACRDDAAPARCVVWNDMFDPQQNATADYYLAHGDLAGAWDGLAHDVVVANWNGEHLESSLRFFSGQGHEQVWAGYYDGKVEDVAGVLPVLDRVPGVVAVMYTTWRDRYDDLEAFARLVRGSR